MSRYDPEKKNKSYTQRAILEKIGLSVGGTNYVCDFIELLSELDIERISNPEFRNSYYHKIAHDLLGTTRFKLIYAKRENKEFFVHAVNRPLSDEVLRDREHLLSQCTPETRTAAEYLYMSYDTAMLYMKTAANNLGVIDR